MHDIDLNLLTALDALLAENSVTRAAAQLGLSTSAMSRTLVRLRAATGDRLLVRAGRVLVPTPHAAALRECVHALHRAACGVLQPAAAPFDAAGLTQTFTLRTNEGFLAAFSAQLLATVAAVSPGVCLRFVPKADKQAGPLRQGAVDLEIGVPGTLAPEMHLQLLFYDHFVGVARAGHPLWSGRITPKRYAACRHVVASRRHDFTGPVDAALVAAGLQRTIGAVVPGFPDALRIARDTDLVALVPYSCVHGATARKHHSRVELRAFKLPVPTPEIAIHMIWHPRMDADPAQRWLRGVVAGSCRTSSRV